MQLSYEKCLVFQNSGKVQISSKIISEGANNNTNKKHMASQTTYVVGLLDGLG